MVSLVHTDFTQPFTENGIKKIESCPMMHLQKVLAHVSLCLAQVSLRGMYFKISSAICFNLDQSKVLSSGNGLIYSLVTAWQ